MSEMLWTSADMSRAMAATASGPLPDGITGLSIDTRTLKPGEAYFAIKGDVHDGHAFVAAAMKAGAGLAVVARDKRSEFPADAPLLMVDDVLDGLRALAHAARARTKAKVIAVTGSVGKTTTKEALLLALSADGPTHASVASFNNHWGVPLSLARCPASAKYAVFEIGMNHAGEITPLTQMVKPDIAVITTIEPVHLEFFGTLEAIADAKAEIFLGAKGGIAVLNRDNGQYARLKAAAEAAGLSRIVSFGEHKDADTRLIDCALRPTCSCVHASILGQDISYKIAMPGRHLVMNSLAVLSAATLAGADLAIAALALAKMVPPPGRGAREQLAVAGGTALLVDESYNANPASMRAALTVLGQAEIGARGRRLAVLGDMLELGPDGPDLHRSLAAAIKASGVDLVFCSGPLMQNLFDALPPAQRGGYATSSAGLEAGVTAAIRAGDVVMVKGSAGSKMKIIVAALERRYPRNAALDDAAV
jgi:UDP-N-acetylmuramoyl-tripeptide--D-alanyl-D-alanine ligase